MLRTLRFGQPSASPCRWRVLIACVVLLLAMGTARVYADALDGVLEVHSAYVNVENGSLLLHARVEYPVNPDIRNALRDGVALTFDLETRIDRERRLWFDSTLADVTLRRELTYHAVSDRFVVHDDRSGQQDSYATLEEALAHLGRIDGWPILVEPQMIAGHYLISVRAGVRRGRMPASLRALFFWTDDWHRVSEWYSWSLLV